jgi:hypothetical protein
MSSSSVFLRNSFLAIRFNKLFKTCTGVYYHYKDIVYTSYSECGDLIPKIISIHIESLLTKLTISNLTRVNSLKKNNRRGYDKQISLWSRFY